MESLGTEKEVMSTWKNDYINPVVSICCTAYNHGKYIEKTLKGFLMQETEYPFEILIHDDASPDNTAEVIRKYEKQYPNIIRVIYQDKNQYSQGISPNLEYNFLRAKGEFLAMCEGDDYWIDSKKIQKQVSFLMENKNYIASSHKFNIIDDNDNIYDKTLQLYNHGVQKFTLENTEQFKLPGQLATLIYRNIWKEIKPEIIEMYRLCKTNGDRKLSLLLTLLDDIFIFEEVMSNYRHVTSSGTSWSARTSGSNLLVHRYRTLLELDKFAQLAFEKKLNYKKVRLQTIYIAIITFFKKMNSENYNVLSTLLKLNVDRRIDVVKYLSKQFFIYPFRKIQAFLK